MGLLGQITYNLFMFPFERAVLHGFRKGSVAKASGEVLEIGVGTGVNAKYLDERKIESLTVIDTSIRKPVIKSMKRRFRKFQYSESSVEKLPYPDCSFDTIVFTLVFCSVDDPEKGLLELRRVLRDDGQMIFIEHVRPEGRKIRKISDKVNPYWNSFSNGCNINRETLNAITGAGFGIKDNTFKRKGVFITGTAYKI